MRTTKRCPRCGSHSFAFATGKPCPYCHHESKTLMIVVMVVVIAACLLVLR